MSIYDVPRTLREKIADDMTNAAMKCFYKYCKPRPPPFGKKLQKTIKKAILKFLPSVIESAEGRALIDISDPESE